MAYTKQEWKDLPDKTTPFTAKRMNHLEQGISDLYDAIFPVGQIVIKGDNEDYSNWLGFTWERTALGKVLVGIDSSDTDFNTIGKTGGEKAHTLSVSEMPSHQHELSIVGGGNLTVSAVNWEVTSTGRRYAKDMISATGGGQPHNIVQPYQVVAYWKRIA